MFDRPLISRRFALEHGLHSYFTGKPCRFKHVDLRVVSSRACQACELAHRIAAQTDDPSHVLNLLLEGDHTTSPRDYLRIVGAKTFGGDMSLGKLRLPEHIDGEPVTWQQRYGRIGCYTNTAEVRRSNPELQRRATPRWANRELIHGFYDERDRRTRAGGSWVVDHVIPLHHPRVCGLHVHNNLQVITALENTRRRGIFVQETTIFSYCHSEWNRPKERFMPDD